jgi:thiaminase
MAATLFARLRTAADETWPAYTRHDFVVRLERATCRKRRSGATW